MTTLEIYQIVDIVGQTEILISPVDEFYTRIYFFSDGVHDIGNEVLSGFAVVSDIKEPPVHYPGDNRFLRDNEFYAAICDTMDIPATDGKWSIMYSDNFVNFIDDMPVGGSFFGRIKYLREDYSREIDQDYIVFKTVRFDPYDNPDIWPETWCKNITMFVRLLPYDRDYEYCTIRFRGYKIMAYFVNKFTTNICKETSNIHRIMMTSGNMRYESTKLRWRTVSGYNRGVVDERIILGVSRSKVLDSLGTADIPGSAMVGYINCTDLCRCSNLDLYEIKDQITFTTTSNVW